MDKYIDREMLPDEVILLVLDVHAEDCVAAQARVNHKSR